MLPVALVLLAVLLAAAWWVRWAHRIPVAYAWDPQSHEKMLCHSLDILRASAAPTLLGWVLKVEQDRSQGQWSCVLEMRRGSIEEDMNSDAFFGATFQFWANPNNATGYLIDTRGANGNYHFHNPFLKDIGKQTGLSDIKTGLSDINWKTAVIAGINRAECPAPSAVERAFSASPVDFGLLPVPWHFDSEYRNYTYADAGNYFQAGNLMLAFYSLGRVCHLLHDMAVPAHVRNDAHLGALGDPSDPLEWLAEALDGVPNEWDFKRSRQFPAETLV